MIYDFIKSKAELLELSDLLHRYLGPSELMRVSIGIHEQANFIDGKKVTQQNTWVQINSEDYKKKTFRTTESADITPQNISDLVGVCLNLEEIRSPFDKLELPFPTDTSVYWEPYATNTEHFDEEFRKFSKDNPNTILGRSYLVVQEIILHSNGMTKIQSIPHFSVRFDKGYVPMNIGRFLSAVCNTDKDIEQFGRLAKYIPDPTPDRKISRCSSFSEAFKVLYDISDLKYGSLKETGTDSKSQDIVVISGVPIHEIFGHHFEIPVYPLSFARCNAFGLGDNIKNHSLILKDDPHCQVENYRCDGFTHFDSYGRSRPTVTHIADGEVKGFLASDYADDSKVKSFANIESAVAYSCCGTQGMNNHFPQARMSCTVLDGDVEDIDLEGKIVVFPENGDTDLKRKSYFLGAQEAYFIRDGKAQRIPPVQITGGIILAMQNLRLLPDWSYQSGTCIKANPLNSSERSSARVSQFTRNQVWGEQQVFPVSISDKQLKYLRSPR